MVLGWLLGYGDVKEDKELEEQNKPDIGLDAAKEKADEGDYVMLLSLGMKYYNEDDYENARLFFEYGVEKKNAMSMYYLGLMDEDKRKEYYDMAFTSGLRNRDFLVDYGILNGNLNDLYKMDKCFKFAMKASDEDSEIDSLIKIIEYFEKKNLYHKSAEYFLLILDLLDNKNASYLGEYLINKLTTRWKTIVEDNQIYLDMINKFLESEIPEDEIKKKLLNNYLLINMNVELALKYKDLYQKDNNLENSILIKLLGLYSSLNEKCNLLEEKINSLSEKNLYYEGI